MSTSRNRTQATAAAAHAAIVGNDPLTASMATPDMMTGTTHIDPINAVDVSKQKRAISLGGDMSLEDLRDSLNSQVSYDMNDPDLHDFIADTKFMEEKVLVRVLPSSDQNAERIVDVFCNGTPQRFPRGHWVIARRMFVEVLARAKPFSVSTPEYVDANGDRTTRMDITPGTRYPFEIRDQNPIGQAWLTNVMHQA